MGNLNLSLTFGPVLTDGTNLTAPLDSAAITLTGTKGIWYNKNVTTADSSFDLGAVSTIGYVRIRNRAQVVSVTTPTSLVITEGGTPGATARTYKVVAVQSDGTYSAASAPGSTTTGNATLTTGNFETLNWTASTGAVDHYAIYRTVAGGTPNTTGIIGTVLAGITTFNDTGFAGDSSTAPSVAADNLLLYGDLNADYPLSLNGGEFAVFRWNSAAIHAKANTATIPVEIAILDS